MSVSSSAMSTRVTPGTPPRRAGRRRSRARARRGARRARAPERSRAPCLSLAVDPGAVVGDREHDVAVALRERDRDVVAAVLERVLEELGEDERERGRALAGERDAARARAVTSFPATSPWTSIARSRSTSSPRSTSSSRCSVSTSCTAAIARIRLTESLSDFCASTFSARACSRSSEATDCRLFLTRWWISCASTPRITARPCSSATAAWCAIASSSASSSAENGVSRSQTSSPICRRFQRSGSRTLYAPGAALRPRDLPVLEHERRTGRVQRLHRRLHDRLERLLEVEGLRDGLRDARERLELGDAPLRALVELRVLDRLRDLRRDRDEELDLGVGERPRLARADVERALELVGAGHDRDGEDRLVLVLGQVRKLLEARVEVRLRGDHDRRALRGGDTRDPLARTHARRARELLDARAVRRAQHELVRALVVEVDEARVGAERVGDLARDELEHLL